MSRRRQTPVWALLFTVALLVSGAPRVVRAVEIPVFDPTDCTIVKDPLAATTDPIDGTEGDDVICGTAGDDVINGLGGNDTIWGGGGNDTITGGAGTDTIYGEDGNDHIDGGEGDDTEYAGDGDDYVAGGPGADSLFAGDGSDALMGDAGPDSIFGEEGNDLIDGGTESDTIDGGIGNDLIDGGAGNDALNGGIGNDQIDGGTGNDTEYGGPGADRLFGGDGRDALLAEAGNDYISGGPGVDSGSGGAGVDYCTKATGETISSCFNDASGPQLVSIAVSPKTIDTSASSQLVTVRMRVKDLGAGISGFCKEGESEKASGIPCGDNRIYASFIAGAREYIFGLDGRLCLPSGHGPDDWHELGYSEFFGSLCRISGTPNDGIYEGSVLVKRYTPRTTFKLDTFLAWDDAGNRNRTTTLSASFKQTSLGDGVGPQLISAAFCVPDGNGACVTGATFDTSSGSQLIKLRARVKDSGSGLGEQLDLTIATLPLTGSSAGRGLGVSVPATGNAVRISGDAKDGIYEQTYYVPKYFPKSSIYLIRFIAKDLAGNVTQWGKDAYGTVLKSKKLRVSVKQIGAGDATPATLSSLSFSPISVDVSSAEAVVEVRFRWVDAKPLFPNRDDGSYDQTAVTGCISDSGGNVQFCFDGNYVPEVCPAELPAQDLSFCRVSGTATDGIYRTTLVIPQNARKGVLRLAWLLITDAVGNERYYEGTGIPRALRKTVTVQ